MELLGVTDAGIRRANNQDCYRFHQDDDFSWAVVCDGVGGDYGGEIASALVADNLEKTLKKGMRSSISTKSITDLLEVAFSRSEIALMDHYSQDSALSRMGTTVVGAVVSQMEAVIFWAGDSRAYLLRKDSLIQLSTDHSVVAEMVKKGELTVAEAEYHPKRNQITNWVGVLEHPRPEYTFITLEEGDCLFLCSDGVSDYIDSKDLPGVVAGAVINKNLEGVINRAIQGGGGDNITAVLMATERR